MATPTNLVLPSRGFTARRLAIAWNTAFRAVHLWYRRHRDRRQLTLMEDYLLRDIGLTRDQVLGESLKHFWQG